MNETPNTNDSPTEVLDDLLEVVVAYADDLGARAPAIQLMNDAMHEVDLRVQLYRVLIGGNLIIDREDVIFLALIRKLIAHAGPRDNDLYND